MTFQEPVKKKRGRPRKHMNNSSSHMVDNNNNSQNQQHHLANPELIMSNYTKASISDWEVELDDTSNPINPVHLENNLSSGSDTHVNPESELNQKNTYLVVRPELLSPVEIFQPETKSNNPVTLESLNLNTSPQARDNINQVSAISNNGNLSPISQPHVAKLPTTIHIIDGEKGGAGKSFVSRAFIEYCASIKYELAIIDADTSNQDIAKIYPDVESAFFSDDDKQASLADKIFDMAFKKSVIVNLPAQVYSKVTDWINNNNLTELGKENSIYFVKWFVCTGGVDSVNFFIQSLDDLGENISHVFVKNLGLCDDWEYVDNMPEFIAAKKKYQFITMDFPKFPFWERNTIDRLGITFSDALCHPELKVISKQRVKNFLQSAYTAFAQTGLVQ
jgi:hypothetical protein